MSKKILVERDVEVPMRDGVCLRADIYRAESDQQLPVLLQRTPYGKGFAQIPFAFMAAEQGYAVVIQDTRGRWSSDGENYPLIYEKEDGYDSLSWIEQQSWSNGKVGMYGGSYVGYTQWAAAVTHHPALKTIIPAVTFCNPYEMMYSGGALSLGIAVSWGLMAQAQMEIERLRGNDTKAVQIEKARLWEQLIEQVDGMAQKKTFHHLPLKDLPLIGEAGITPFFKDLLQHPQPDVYWQRVACSPEEVKIPALYIGGWYDIFIASTLRDFSQIRSMAQDEWVRNQQKLIVGPWIHGAFEGLNGEVDFSLQASWILVLPDETQLRWFDYWLKGDENGMLEEAPVRIFVMGENRWRDENEWPLARTHYVPYYLHSSGVANTLNGDGSLSPIPPVEEPVDTFVFDPRNPVPTRGGGLCCWQAALPPGAYDQREIEARPDVLVYSTPPLETDLEVTGSIQVNLWAASNAPDTDFTAKLVDVGPDGYARNIQDGIIRARYRQEGQISPLEAAKAYIFKIDLAATSNLFKAGHQIRLEISSSNFPRFDRNTNTGYPTSESSQLVPALQTIIHDADHPSHILLPVISR